MATVVASDGYEQRFSALLKPIRDLHKNWEIDIAYYLEPYLEELQLIRITFDGGQTTLNFAEAAMLIQGSASIYSKKVDYLYNLVKELLDLLNSQKKGKKGANKNDDKEEEEQQISDKSIDVEQLVLVSDDAQDLPPVKLRTRAPVDLIPLDSDERGNTSFYDVKGDLIGSKGDFKLNAWQVISDGICVYSLPFYHTYNMPQSDTKVAVKNCDDDDDYDNDNHDFDGCPEPVNFSIENGLNSSVMQKGVSFDANEMNPENSVATSPDPAKPIKPLLNEKKARAIWKPICAFDVNPAKVPPMKKGRTLKSRRKEVVPKCSQFSEKAFFSHVQKFPKQEFLKPSVDALHNVFYNEFKRRKSIAEHKKSVSSEKLEEDEANVMNDIADDINNSDEDCADAGDFEDMERLRNESCDEIENPISLGISVTLSETNLNESYEEIIKRHTENYLVKARDEIKLSDMEKNVLEWSNSLSGVLAEEEKRENFDIRDYCTRILDKFSTKASAKVNKETLKFADVVKAQPSHNIARLFLSTLQLANNYNVEIQVDEEARFTEATKLDQLQLTLLSKRQHFEAFEEFHT